MKQMMYVGARCGDGGHNLTLGKIEIEPGTAPSALHAQLRHEGWPEGQNGACEECGTTIFVSLDKAIILEPVVVLSQVRQ
jgi:hypothetical protein